MNATEEPGERTPRPLPREVRRLGWISFWMDVAGEMSYPLIPLFVQATFSAPGRALGMIEGTAEGLQSVMTALSGLHSDRLRRRVPFIRLGYGLSAVAKPLIALAQATWQLTALRAFDRVGKGVRGSARDALIADVTPPEQRGAAFGLHRTLDTAGALVGVALVSILLSYFPGSFRTLFALTLLPGLIGVALCFFLREPATHGAPRAAAPPLFAAARALPKRYWVVVALLWLFALGNSSDTFLLLRLKQTGLSDSATTWTYALFNLVYTLSALPFGRLSDRLGRARVLALGWALFAIVYSGFALYDGPVLIGLYALYGLHMGIAQGVARAWIADLAPREGRATAMGLYHFGYGLVVFASSLFAGWLYDTTSRGAPFAFGAICAGLALLLLPFVARR